MGKFAENVMGRIYSHLHLDFCKERYVTLRFAESKSKVKLVIRRHHHLHTFCGGAVDFIYLSGLNYHNQIHSVSKLVKDFCTWRSGFES